MDRIFFLSFALEHQPGKYITEHNWLLKYRNKHNKVYYTLTHDLWFQPVLHNWFNKDCGMNYPVCGMMHIKHPLLLIEKVASEVMCFLSPSGLTYVPTPNNHK